MKKLIAGALVASALALPGTASAASLVNNGFEAGLVGWTGAPSGLVSVVTTFTEPTLGGATYNPVEGNSFAVLQAGAPGVSTGLTQFFQMSAGETIKFAVAFAGGDYLPYNDAGSFGILNFQDLMFPSTVLFSETITSVGDYGNTPWTFVSFTATVAGNYSVNASVTNALDGANPSFLLIDAVPEPSTWLMMLFGFGAIGFAMRRKQNVRVSFA